MGLPMQIPISEHDEIVGQIKSEATQDHKGLLEKVVAEDCIDVISSLIFTAARFRFSGAT